MPITRPRVAQRRAAHYHTEVAVKKLDIHRASVALSAIVAVVMAIGAANKF
jgi:hypothetical protein